MKRDFEIHGGWVAGNRMQLPRILTSRPSSQGQRGEGTLCVLKCPGPSRPLAPHSLLLEAGVTWLCRTLCLWRATPWCPLRCPLQCPFPALLPSPHLGSPRVILPTVLAWIYILTTPSLSPALLVAQLVKNSTAIQVQFLGQEDPLEKG